MLRKLIFYFLLTSLVFFSVYEWVDRFGHGKQKKNAGLERFSERVETALRKRNFIFGASGIANDSGNLVLNSRRNYILFDSVTIQLNLASSPDSGALFAGRQVPLEQLRFRANECVDDEQNHRLVFETELDQTDYLFQLGYDKTSGVAELTIRQDGESDLVYTGLITY